VTTLALVPAAARAEARIVARVPLVVAGMAFAAAAFKTLSTRVRTERLAGMVTQYAPGRP